ncbi:MAG: endopeptidase La [Firmicutes bacterium]|nr:endopeptidase La [Bacillota bacterium]
MADDQTIETKKTEILPLIALRGVSVFPATEVRFDVGREKSVQALEKALNENSTLFLTNQKDMDIDLPVGKDLYTTGTVVRVKRVLRMPGEHLRVHVQGQYRAKIKRIIQENPYFACEVTPIEELTVEPSGMTTEVHALIRTCEELLGQYKTIHPVPGTEDFHGFSKDVQPGYAADYAASQIELNLEDYQKVLAATAPLRRLRLVVKLLGKETRIAEYEKELNAKLQAKLTKAQKENYLREQMHNIQEELGQNDDIRSEAEEWSKKLKKLKLSSEITEKIQKDIDRASRLPSYSSDLPVLRTLLETVLELPWNKSLTEPRTIEQSQQILEEDHYGLEKVKERIIEFLAVQKLAGMEKSPILCLVGPPGVGKTSIAKSIARATGRKFVRMSLGGVRDEAEIRGHRRTYVGAIPGRIITSIRDCKSCDPVFLFDEIDKIGADYKGDPAAALLEVLDPEQNKDFVDHYLEVPFDLSRVMFITTANTTDTIPRPLLDRMEIIELSSYTGEEKLNIAKKYLVPKQLKAHGLEDRGAEITEDALQEIINSYTRESGVRGLEKQIAQVCRKIVLKVVKEEPGPYTVTADQLEALLGKKRYFYDKQLQQNEVGVATGLAWTSVGGETLFIETSVLPGTGQIVLTGQLGDVMKESAKTAISYVRSVASLYQLEEDFYKTKDIHIHIPEGATPKDGPSAGVTMCISVLSALTGRPVRKDIAMTGEISLRGRILPVGGIKEKLLAAHRMGIRKIMLPEENSADLQELPANIREQLEFVLLKTAEDAIREALL